MAAAGRQVAMPVTSLSPVTAASASGPMQAGRKEKKEEPKDNWHFSADKSEKGELPSGGIGFILGMNNAADPKHGTEFQNMMAALKGNAVAKGNRRHLGGMAYDAMAANSAEASLKSMEAYRKKLKSEWGNRAERKRQIKILDDMIERARADMTRGRDLQTTTLEGSEFSGAIRGGGVNQVYRYARGEQGAEKGAYFKPDKPGANEVEAYMMDYTGIDKPGEGRGPHLSDREIAFSRLGALLGTSVTLDSKKATLGEGTPTGRQDPRSGRSFEPTAGTSGAVTEEAKGKSWLDFNWRYYGIGSADESDYPPNPMRVLLDPPNDSGTNVGSRLDRAEGVLQPTTTERGSFGGRALLGDDAFSDFFGELDMADPDYQRQMNELFLLDTLAGHLDRHAGNFMINRGEDGKIGVKAIDNDLTFGKKTPFGKKGGAVHYGGLPEQMQIDARMAQRIGSIDHDTLVTTFSDVLTREEIAALEERFGKMKKYIQALAKEDPSLLVEQWNEDTAKREFRLAGGINSAQHENDPGAKGYSGNNYFQRQMLMLNAADMRNQTLYNAAKGLFDPDE